MPKRRPEGTAFSVDIEEAHIGIWEERLHRRLKLKAKRFGKVTANEANRVIADRISETVCQVAEFFYKNRVVIEEIRSDEFSASWKLMNKADVSHGVAHETVAAVGLMKGSAFPPECRKVVTDQVKQTGRGGDKPIEVVRGILAAVLAELKSYLAPDAETDQLTDGGPLPVVYLNGAAQ